MQILDLCTGIGGLTLGYLAHGYQPAIFCEQNQYCQQVLKARFKDIPIIPNIKNVTAATLSNLGIRNINGIVAGLPCPAFSVAGKQQGSKDPRNLFPEFFRIVCEIQPRWFVLENVPGLLTAEDGRFFAGVLREIAALGFDAEWEIISAASVGAVHLRERIFIIAYTKSLHKDERCLFNADSIRNGKKARRNESEKLGNAAHPQSRTQTQLFGCDRFPQAGTDSAFISRSDAVRRNPLLESEFCAGNDGISTKLDRCLLRHDQLTDWLTAATIPRVNRLSAAQIATLSQSEQQAYRECWSQYQQIRRQHKEEIAALGNAVVPQVAIKVFQRLQEILHETIITTT